MKNNLYINTISAVLSFEYEEYYKEWIFACQFKIASIIKISSWSTLIFLQYNRNLQCIRSMETIKKKASDVRVSLLRVPQCHGNASPDARAIKRTYRSWRSYFCNADKDVGGKQKNSSHFRTIKFLCSVFINSTFVARILRNARAITLQQTFYKFKKIAIIKRKFDGENTEI